MSIYGVGTTIVECVRIAKTIERHGEQFLVRVYSSSEIEHCVQSAAATQLFATRWAAKEAVMKAMNCYHQAIMWTDIEVISGKSGGPTIGLSGRAAQWAEEIGVKKLHVSLGACRTHATAYVIAGKE